MKKPLPEQPSQVQVSGAVPNNPAKKTVMVELTQEELHLAAVSLLHLSTDLEKYGLKCIKDRAKRLLALAWKMDSKWQQFPQAFVLECKTEWFLADKQRSPSEPSKAE